MTSGRNRREACRIAKVEPTYEQLEGDAVSFILSSNIQRRHLTKGQRAMAVAKITPATQQGKKRTSEISAEVISERYVRMARMVLALAKDHADAVSHRRIAELNGNGHSTREIADVVGVAHKTVARDLAVSNDTAPDKADTLTIDSDSDSVSNDTAPWNDPPLEKSQAAKEREEAEIEAARIQGRNLGLKQLFNATLYLEDSNDALDVWSIC
jgi:hypothetical protein